MWDYLIPAIGIYIFLINLISFFAMGIDKLKAKKNKWRIPEGTLLLFCFLGGGVGGLLGMSLFRHKTKHLKFQILVTLSLLLWLAAGIYIAVRYINV